MSRPYFAPELRELGGVAELAAAGAGPMPATSSTSSARERARMRARVMTERGESWAIVRAFLDRLDALV